MDDTIPIRKLSIYSKHGLALVLTIFFWDALSFVDILLLTFSFKQELCSFQGFNGFEELLSRNCIFTYSTRLGWPENTKKSSTKTAIEIVLSPLIRMGYVGVEIRGIKSICSNFAWSLPYYTRLVCFRLYSAFRNRPSWNFSYPQLFELFHVNSYFRQIFLNKCHYNIHLVGPFVWLKPADSECCDNWLLPDLFAQWDRFAPDL